jgi:hypothetical protein
MQSLAQTKTGQEALTRFAAIVGAMAITLPGSTPYDKAACSVDNPSRFFLQIIFRRTESEQGPHRSP